MKYQTIGGVKYHVKGTNPQLVIHGGTHGDEYHVIAPLKRVIQRMYDELPDFLFVPAVSPTAVKSKTRENFLGHDMNRVFWGTNSDPEVVANKQILAYASHAVALTFHEDIENNAFYIYDSMQLKQAQLRRLRNAIKSLELPLYDGFDDFEDEQLQYHFVQGYACVNTAPMYKGPFVDDWARYHSHISRMLTIEVPFRKPNIEEALEYCLRLGIQLVEEQQELENIQPMLQYAA